MKRNSWFPVFLVALTLGLGLLGVPESARADSAACSGDDCDASLSEKGEGSASGDREGGSPSVNPLLANALNLGQMQSVPEPGILLGLGSIALGGLAVRRRHR
ncbi:PEP-CTERM sorting domain-containing protein [Baaleninema sp.]|uniref:PEP-CTERM sorting domain-containing protein n=1 Tax=Baaleninema sp. TaxID=3101197 RepID=UPI003CFBDB13